MPAIRVLHCPTNNCGNPVGLARAERSLGLHSWSIAIWPVPLDGPADEVLLRPNHSRFRVEVERWRLTWRALKEFDVIHYNMGMTILPMRQAMNSSSLLGGLYQRIYAPLVDMGDLALSRRKGKRIAVTYQGSDARQGDYSLAHFDVCISRELPSFYTPETDAIKRYAIARFDEFADRIYYLNPDLGWVLPKRARFMPYGHVDMRDWRVVPARPFSERLTVLHAPSRRDAKGTRYILDAVRRLQAEGIAFDFKLVEDIPHDQVRQLYERSDLLVDQLLAGWYGGLSVELMALGKPVICYIREGDLHFVPEEMKRDIPVINATPTTIYEVLKEYLTVRRKELPELGRRSRVYVEKWHEPVKIAAKLKREYELMMAEG